MYRMEKGVASCTSHTEASKRTRNMAVQETENSHFDSPERIMQLDTGRTMCNETCHDACTINLALLHSFHLKPMSGENDNKPKHDI